MTAITGQGHLSSKEEIRTGVLCMLAEHALPFSLLDSRSIPMFFKPEVVSALGTRRSTACQLETVTKQVFADVLELIKVSMFFIVMLICQKSAVQCHLAMDLWTSSSGHALFGMRGYFWTLSDIESPLKSYPLAAEG